MASIQSLGVGSGLLTSELVEDIIAAEREATDLRLDAKRAEFEAKISAFGAIRSSLDSLTSAAGGVGNSDTLLLNTVSSTNEAAVTATASAGANPALHTVEVLATARAHTLTSIRFDSVDDVIGEGTLDFRFGATTFVNGNYDTFTENPERASGQITIDSSNSTVAGVRDAINAAGIGVEASIVNDGEGFVLVLKSDRTGEDHSMEIVATEGASPGLGALNFNATDNTPGTNFTQTVDADDAIVVIDGITVTRETNTIDEVIPDVTFTAVGNNAGAPATISIVQDAGGIADKMQAFVDAYNALKSLTDNLTEFDADEGVGALLTGDSTVRTLMSQLRRFMTRSVAEVESTSIRALIDIGISTNQNAGFQLEFSRSDFESAITGNTDDVMALLADQRRASDNQISFNSFQTGTQAGTYDVEITQAAAQGSYTGSAVAGLAGPITIDDDNDALTVTVNGSSSGEVLLAQGTYADGGELATEIQTQLNLALQDAGATVEVIYDETAQTLSITSSTYGSGSNVGIDVVDTNTLALLGLDVSAAENNVGLDVRGTVNGIEGTGTGQFLSIPSGPTPATSGVYEGQSIAAFDTPPLTIDSDNDTFRVSVDGTLSNDIVLTAGDYASGAALASEIESQINADTTLTAVEKSVSVTFDAANNRFEITSASTGPGSSVNLTFAEAGVVSDLGLNVAIGAPGRAASSVADPAAGIQLRVQGTAVGERGTVTLVRGVMNQIESFLGQLTDLEGSLTNKEDGLDEQLSAIDEEAQDFSKRMDLLEERLRIQFAAADALISTLNNTSDFLTSQLATLPGYSNEN